MKSIKNNWKLKLLSVLGAIILWSFVISIENPTVSLDIRDIPITFENENKLNDKGLVLLDDDRPKINLTIKGPRSKMLNMTAQHIKVSTDLSRYNEGLSPLNLDVDLPRDIELASEPAPINIEIQKVITKKFHVEIELEGNLEEGYILEFTKATPEEISVKGPRSKVESINKIRAVLSIDDVTKDMVTNVDLEALTKDDKVVDNVILGQNFANISVDVSKSKEVKIIAYHDNNLAQDLKLISIELEPKTFMIKGDKDSVDRVSELPTKLIDLSKISSSTIIDVALDLPEDIYLVNDSLKFKARVQVEKKEPIPVNEEDSKEKEPTDKPDKEKT
ncbi:MAG: CdaR family protein [Tissierellia bacterium]|nr:CdaR family protein [Tissierellia bacterium]